MNCSEKVQELEYLTDRIYLRKPITEIADAARYLDAALSAHFQGRTDLAEELIHLADIPAIREWTDSLWGKNSPHVQYRTLPDAPPLLSKEQRGKERMPTLAEKNQLLERDGYHCRFCGIPLVRKEVREQIRKLFPQMQIWGDKITECHAALQAMWLQYDHVLPHSRGGNSGLENLLITCAPCNYARMSFTLEEVGLADPRKREPIRSTWDGLERIMKVKTSCPQVKITKNSESCEEDSKEVKPKQNKWGLMEYVNFINEQNQPIVASYLLDLVEFFKSRHDLFYIKPGSGKSPSIVIQNSFGKSICTLNKENFMIALTLPSQIQFVNTLREKYDEFLKWSLPFEIEKWPTLKTLSNLKPSDFGILKEFILEMAISAKDLNE
jgi:5-methylcytosine-specific restriction endonuclease McrA